MKDNNFASADLTMGQLNALVKKMGGKGKVLDFLAGRLRLTQFFDYEHGIVHLKIEKPALITQLEWRLQLGERFDDFNRKFVSRLSIAEAYHTFEELEVCIYKRPLTEDQMMIDFLVTEPSPNLVFQLQKVIPDGGISLMDYNELLIMHKPIQRKKPGQPPAQMALLMGGSITCENFRGSGNKYPEGTGFVYVKKKHVID